MFIARISKGRTIRQFVIYVIGVPSLVSFIWFSILGGAAFDLQLNQDVDMKAVIDSGYENALFETLREFPLSTITVALAVFLVAIFFITGADSASIVMGMLSQRGKEVPMRALTIFWGVATGAVAGGAALCRRARCPAEPGDRCRRTIHVDSHRHVRLPHQGAAPRELRLDPSVPGASRRTTRGPLPRSIGKVMSGAFLPRAQPRGFASRRLSRGRDVGRDLALELSVRHACD